jgi:hypothetical protein
MQKYGIRSGHVPESEKYQSKVKIVVGENVYKVGELNYKEITSY